VEGDQASPTPRGTDNRLVLIHLHPQGGRESGGLRAADRGPSRAGFFAG